MLTQARKEEAVKNDRNYFRSGTTCLNSKRVKKPICLVYLRES